METTHHLFDKKKKLFIRITRKDTGYCLREGSRDRVHWVQLNSAMGHAELDNYVQSLHDQFQHPVKYQQVA